MASLTQFSRNMDRRATRITTNVTKLKRSVAANVLSLVVQLTPIKSGRARYAWNVSMNRPDRSFDFKSFNDGSRVGDWVGKMATSRGAIARATANDAIYISNGLPYIGDLNRGASSQAPAGYVQNASTAGAQVARRTRILR